MNLDSSFSVIIVTWNALHLLKKFLPFVAITDYPNFEIIIADNASTDGTAKWIKEEYPACKIVTYGKNYGYASGNNKAVKYANGDILVFLNNDVKPEPGWLSALNVAFREKNTIIAQPKIKSYKEPHYFEYAGAAGGFIDWLGYPFCRGRIFQHTEEDHGQYDNQTQLFWASGAALAIKKKWFEQSGGFDEDFKFHMEEIDLCWRCLKMGAEIVAVPKSVVYHVGGGSLSSGSSKKTYYNYRNNLLMLLKNLDRFLFFKIFLRLILDGISGFRELFYGNPKNILAIIRAHFSFYARVPVFLNKRKTIKKLATHSTPANLVHQRLIVVDFFIRGKRRYIDL